MSRKGYLPGGVGEAAAILSGRLATAISKYPSGRYGLCGSMPVQLTQEKINACGQRIRVSKVYETEQEVIDALLSIGITRFQKADCSWYQAAE